MVTITNPVLQFKRLTLPDADPPEFTLTCDSTGGPPTTVIWTRDGAATTGTTDQIVTDLVSISFSSILRVKERLLGSYRCSVSNDRTAQPATGSLTVAGEALCMETLSLLRGASLKNVLLSITMVVQNVGLHAVHIIVACSVLLLYTAAPSRPTDIRAVLITGSDNITVSWTPPSGGTPPTGYVIYYEATSGGADAGSTTVSGASTSEVTITGRASNEYTVKIVSLSDQLPSTVTETTTISGESTYVC